MANRVLSIVAKVKDAASAGLQQIQSNLKKTGSAAKQTSMDFTQFNRIMFATSAYAGLFAKGFQSFGDNLLKGAEFDRVVGQFERVMGPKGDLFKAIGGFTDNSIDKVEALRSGIAMKTLGIATSTSQVAELIARAGTASKLAGMESGEGIKKFTQFLKDGSIANLEFLNLIKSNDPGLKLQMSLISKMGGVLGGAMTAQMKYSMGLRLLRAATDGQLKGQRDLYDVVFDSKQAFTLLKNEIGIFFGTALTSVIDKITKLVDKFSSMLEYIRTTKKEILFLVKAVTTVSAAFAGLMGAAGTIRLVSLGLKALGISTAPIIFGITTIIGLFSALTYKVKEGTTPVERFIEKLRVFSAVLKGVYQLVSSYITSQDNMRKGIGKIDKDLYELLNKNGLFVFVHNVSKVLATLVKFGIEVFKQLYSWAVSLDSMFGSLSNKIAEIFGVNKKIDVDLEATGNVIDEPSVKRLSSHWLNANSKAYGFLKKGAAAILTAFMAYKLLGIGKGFLSHIPLIGRLFKGGPSGKPDGTKSNPIHVIMDKTFGNMMKQGLFDGLLGSPIQGPVPKGGAPLGRAPGLMGRATRVILGDTLGSKLASLANKATAPIVRVASPVVRVISKPLAAISRPLIRVAAPIIRLVTKPLAAARSMFAGLWMTLAPLMESSTFLGRAFQGIVGAVSKVRSVFMSIGNVELGVLFRSLFARSWIAIASRLVGMKDAIGMVIAGFNGLSKGAALLRGFQIVHLVLAGIGLLIGVINGLMDNFSSFTGLFGAAYDYLRSVDYASMFNDLYNSISATFDAVVSTVSEMFSSMYDTISSALAAAMEPLSQIGQFIYAKLEAGFGLIKPYLIMVLDPLGRAFDQMRSWIDVVLTSLKAFYEGLINIPVVGDLVKAAVTSMTDPVGTFKGLGEMMVGLPAMGADYLADALKGGATTNLIDQAQGGKGKMAFMPETAEKRQEYAQRAIEQASGMDQQRMIQAYKQAMEGTSAGGAEITPEEFAHIFGFALDNSKIAKHTKDTKDELKAKPNTLTSRRGGC